MWQRFTERARKVVFYAQEEAQRIGDGYVSTEHLLLGLIREEDTTAGEALRAVGVDRQRLREAIEAQQPKPEPGRTSDMTLTPRAKRVIDLAYDEARTLSHNYIGTEHLLLGIVREGDGLGGRILSEMGVELKGLRTVVGQLSPPSHERASGTRPSNALLEAVRSRFGFKVSRGAAVLPEDAGKEMDNAAMWERCTPRARAIISRAQENAIAQAATGVGAEHLILALLEDPTSRGMRAISTLNADLDRVRRAAEALASVERAEEIPEPIPEPIPFSPSGQSAVTAAHVASIAMGNPFLGTEHLALVLFGGAVGEFTDPVTLTPVRVREVIARSQAED